MGKKYVINKKEFNKTYKLAKDIYGISTVIEYYVQKYIDIDDIDTICPILKFLRKTADDLCYF